MTYQEIRNELKALKEQNHAIPPLNSKKEVLQAALDQILATIAATETTEAIAPTESPAAPKPLDFTTTNQYPAFLTALATIFAFLQSLVTKATPYLVKALRYVQVALLPRIALAARFAGLVVFLIVFKILRKTAIA